MEPAWTVARGDLSRKAKPSVLKKNLTGKWDPCMQRWSRKQAEASWAW